MLPDRFKARMEKLLGETEYKAFEASFDTEDERHHALRMNTLKVEDTGAGRVLAFALGKEAESIPWEKRGFYYEGDAAPGKHPYHEAGLYYIQEPSAMAPVSFLDPKPGDRVLDLCAAPGGKSTQIADRLSGEGLLVTNEINRDRAKILSLNIERMGIGNALVLNEDSAHLADVFEGYFDKILVDAPCSGEGMFRKNEAAFSEWSEENVKLCAARQEEILDNAAKMLLPGGRLVYSTCTFAPEENEENVFKFLMKHPDFHVASVELVGGMENGRAEFISEEVKDACKKNLLSAENSGNTDSTDYETNVENAENIVDAGSVECAENVERALAEISRSVRLWPHKVRGEGHFLCVFEREGSSDKEGNRSYIPGGKFIRAKKDMTAPYEEFCKETLVEGTKLPGAFLKFGDQLYIAPEDMPSIMGLKALRPGLHLGTVKKDRFEPSHALALHIRKEDVKLSIDLSSDSAEIRQFLNGQTLRFSGDQHPELKDKKGWCLVLCDGYSIGWGKLAGGMLKNHYPKGLRINY
ncbi:MAG: RsmF rRNA methyltransferase first C-terminal domain-containing protein [Butyrivibrio sp.]|nr:RsmF rRNA methyltransferase first C-terminal domain-containing protein [Butyrivibrio sp.]